MDNLYKIRMRKKMSQVSLATKINVAQETVSAYESGKVIRQW
jgi:DNA-binding XRE family transcriptional regulator